MRKSIYILLLFLQCTLAAYAQDESTIREVYVQAENDYQIGRIEQARDALIAHLDHFHGNMRQNALRLIALSYLARFDIKETERYATLMLQENPYYSPSSNDPLSFSDIIANIKAGMTATITTASSQAESLAEVPVPTTLITAEMIKTSGARNLQEVLAAYVPGMNIIDCDDDINIAMRGIYSNTQEKILVMLNGHRLNSYATNTAAPDFSISLEKIKQIEVLRGPASSLYGGVALTAVVNIITKKGADIDGLQAMAAAGNHGQVKADAILGKHYFDLDMLVWGSLYHCSGEKYDVTNERSRIDESLYGMPVDHIRIGRTGNHPSYDFGLQLGYRGLQFMYDAHFSQVAAPFTVASMALSYDYDRYRTFNGLKPGFSVSSRHADLTYQWSMSNVQWKAAVTYDRSDLTRYQVINDEPMPTLGLVLSLPEQMTKIFEEYGGIYRYVNGQEQDYGAQLKGNYSYRLGDDHKGNIGFGAEYAYFKLDDNRYQIGYDFEQTFPEEPILRNEGTGREYSTNTYLQLKHQWHSLILNAGIRYDHKIRYDNTKIRELSPRVALIMLRPKWNIKLSYSKSFVDAPYIYRKANLLSTLMLASGSQQTGSGSGHSVNYDALNLSPERVHSIQLSFAGTNWTKGLNFEINGFYNRASNLILTSILDYENVSKNYTCGVELMASYKQPKFTADWNFTWTNTFRANLMDFGLPDDLKSLTSINLDANNNTPAIMSNAVLGWQFTPRLKLHTHLLFEGKQTSYNTDLVKAVQTSGSLLSAITYSSKGMYKEAEEAMNSAKATASELIMHKEMPARVIVNIGGDYTLGPVTFGLNVHNLFGTHYYRSGMNTNLIPQKGRWVMGSIGVRL